jgi:type I restriction enzyme S subunit
MTKVLQKANEAVPHGYKQTEVGVIPKEWGAEALGRHVEIKSGESPSLFLFKNDGVPYFKVEQLNNNSKYLCDTPYFFFGDKKVPRGSLIFPKRGASILLNKVRILKQDAFMDTNMMTLTPKASLDHEYLYYALTHIELWRIADTTSIPQINNKHIIPLVVALPPLPEQRAIAGALNDVDALLGALDHLTAKKRDLKQAAMQQLLTGHQRLPSFHGAWESVQFSEIADKSIPWSIGGGPFGSNLKASDYTAEGVRIIQLQNIGDGRFHDNYAIYTSEAKADELLSNNIYPGEIILSKMGDPVARACFVPTANRRYLMASDGIRLAVDSGRFNQRFVHDYINSVYFRKKATEASTGSTRQRIGLVELKQLPFIAPPLDEQTAIAEVLSDMDAELEALEQRRDKTRALKQGMMQELLTGRTRLVDSGKLTVESGERAK